MNRINYIHRRILFFVCFVKAVELNKPGLLSDMLVCPEDVNARHEQSGQALIHAAALTGPNKLILSGGGGGW